MATRPAATRLTALCAVLVATSCADEDAGRGRAAPTPTTRTADIVLTVRVRADRDTRWRRATLTCAASERARATGHLENDPGGACTLARRAAAILVAQEATDRACTEIYGGPQEATVRGHIGAQAVKRDLGRTDGCAITDWDALAGLLNPALPGGTPGVGTPTNP